MMSFISASLANPTGGVVGGTVAGALEANSVVTVSRLAMVVDAIRVVCVVCVCFVYKV
jgi:hypothetical protein